MNEKKISQNAKDAAKRVLTQYGQSNISMTDPVGTLPISVFAELIYEVVIDAIKEDRLSKIQDKIKIPR